MWGSSNSRAQRNLPGLPNKIFGMSVNLFKSLVLAAIGLAIQLTLFFLKRGKRRKLQEIEKKEEEERLKQLEEEWKAS